MITQLTLLSCSHTLTWQQWEEVVSVSREFILRGSYPQFSYLTDRLIIDITKANSMLIADEHKRMKYVSECVEIPSTQILLLLGRELLLLYIKEEEVRKLFICRSPVSNVKSELLGGSSRETLVAMEW